MRRIDWLDGLRGVAILMVLAIHVGLVALDGNYALTNSGFILRQITDFTHFGVQLFFVISAITVSHTLDIQVQNHGANLISFSGWLVRRFFRIAPLYYLAIPTYYVLYHVLHIVPWAVDSYQVGDVLANVAFMHSWVPTANNSVVPGGWSIGCEMNFYVLSAVLVLTPAKRSSILILVSLISFAMLILTNVLSGGNLRDGYYFYSWVPTEFPAFVAGLWAFHFAVSRPGPNSWQANWFWATLVLLGLALNFLNGAFFPDNQLFAPTFMGLCFSGLVALQAEKPFRLLLHPALRQVGNVSYSIYILHFAVCALLVGLPYGFSPLHYLPDEPLLRFSIAFAGVFAISYLFAQSTRVLIELPFISIGRRLSSRYTLTPQLASKASFQKDLDSASDP